MKRRAAPVEAATFSLFPFLAVLLCVMGALIVLLVVIARHSRDTASRQSSPETLRRELEIDREDHQWRIDQLSQSRDQTAAQLAEQRADLSHVEDHARRLRDHYRALEQAATDLERTLAAPQAAADEQRGELARLQSRMYELEQQLDAKRRAPAPEVGYAIIPYDGTNSTRRRPLYLECTSDSIVLQPEGVALTAEDFLGPLGPGNPLAAAMRAQREFLVRGTDATRGKVEPYPLLLVRPDGIEAYYVARAALTSWGSDFGYELVDQKWKLEFPPANAELAKLTQSAVEDARNRQQLLAIAAPGAYDDEGVTYYRASPTAGGLVAEGGPGRRAAGSARRGMSSEWRHRNNGETPFGAGRSFGKSAEKSRSPGGTTSTDSPPTTRNGDARSGVDDGTGLPGVRLTQQNRADAEPIRPGQYVPKLPQSLAERRGANWAAREAPRSAVPLSRKIRVRCEIDRLIIVADDPSISGDQVVMLEGGAEQGVAELVTTVWRHVDRWGIAGQGMYWRPQVVLETTISSAGRGEEILALLEGSGLDVSEKRVSNTAEGDERRRR